MMKLLVYKIFILISFFGFSQTNYNGKVIDKHTKSPLANVSVYNSTENKLSKTNSDGLFDLVIESNNTEILFYIEGYNLKSVIFSGNKNYSIIELNSQIEKLDEVIVRANKKKVFQIGRLKDFEETYVYAGKKNEVILMDLSMANLASNNARQVYSQIPGINIFQNDDAGLQLNIGGRGLNPIGHQILIQGRIITILVQMLSVILKVIILQQMKVFKKFKFLEGLHHYNMELNLEDL